MTPSGPGQGRWTAWGTAHARAHTHTHTHTNSRRGTYTSAISILIILVQYFCFRRGQTATGLGNSADSAGARSFCPSVVESGVTKHTSEDTLDSGVRFIMPACPRGTRFPTRTLKFLRGPVLSPHYVTGYMLATSLLHMIEFTTSRC